MSEAQQQAASALSEAAAEWVIRLNSPEVTAADKQAFMDWMRQSPVHVKEYLSAEVVFVAMQGVTSEDSTNVDALLRQVSSNVVGIPVKGAAGRGEQPMKRAGWSRKPVMWGLGAAAVLILGVGLVILHGRELHDPNVYVTGTGEQRRIVLADGSAIDLNTRSRIRVHFTQNTRDIELAEGEAYFSVAKDIARPFRVISGEAVVRAVGTQFNVYRQDAQTIVTVVEGRVAVIETPEASAPALELSAGQEVALTAHAETGAGSAQNIAAPVATDPRTVATWRQRRLIFESRPLADVVAEFNRYNRRQLVVEDATLAGEPISGVFDADRPEDLIGFLTSEGDVQVIETNDAQLKIQRVGGI